MIWFLLPAASMVDAAEPSDDIPAAAVAHAHVVMEAAGVHCEEECTSAASWLELDGWRLVEVESQPCPSITRAIPGLARKTPQPFGC